MPQCSTVEMKVAMSGTWGAIHAIPAEVFTHRGNRRSSGELAELASCRKRSVVQYIDVLLEHVILQWHYTRGQDRPTRVRKHPDAPSSRSILMCLLLLSSHRHHTGACGLTQFPQPHPPVMGVLDLLGSTDKAGSPRRRNVLNVSRRLLPPLLALGRYSATPFATMPQLTGDHS